MIPDLISENSHDLAGLNLALQSSLSPLASYTTAPPESPPPSALFMDDRLTGTSYKMGGEWDTDIQPWANDLGIQAYRMTTGMNIPMLDGYKGLSPSLTGFGDGSIYPRTGLNSSFAGQKIASHLHSGSAGPCSSDLPSEELYLWMEGSSQTASSG